MERKLISMMEDYLHNLYDMRSYQSDRYKEIEEFADVRLKRRAASKGRSYYYGQKSGSREQIYLGTDINDEVNKIKECRYLNKSITAIENNIKETERFIRNIKPTGYDAINELIPDTYRYPRVGQLCKNNTKAKRWLDSALAIKASRDIYRPEDLKNRTNDGSMVRSKSEAFIYNYLLSVGATFVYELPVRVQNKVLVPDFTILSEFDYSTEIIIEHQGMMEIENYRSRFGEKVYEYLRAGYIQGSNIFYTFDNADGGFDIRTIQEIVENYVKPRLNQS